MREITINNIHWADPEKCGSTSGSSVNHQISSKLSDWVVQKESPFWSGPTSLVFAYYWISQCQDECSACVLYCMIGPGPKRRGEGLDWAAVGWHCHQSSLFHSDNPILADEYWLRVLFPFYCSMIWRSHRVLSILHNCVLSRSPNAAIRKSIRPIAG